MVNPAYTMSSAGLSVFLTTGMNEPVTGRALLLAIVAATITYTFFALVESAKTHSAK